MAINQFNNGEGLGSIRNKLNNTISKVNQLDTVAETHNPVLTFDKNKYTDTAISQSGAINYTLAASGHIDGTVIRHKVVSDGINPINFSSNFNVFNKSDDNIYPAGLQVFYFNYVGGDVDVAIPTYNSGSSSETTYSVSITSPTEGQQFDEGTDITVTAEVTES